VEKTGQLNGFKPKSYGDIVAIASLFAMFMSVVAWGLKLEERNDQLREDIVSIRSQIGNGILPRAEERINQLQRRVDELGDDFDEHDAEHRAMERSKE
jgi:hypothetical protein